MTLPHGLLAAFRALAREARRVCERSEQKILGGQYDKQQIHKAILHFRWLMLKTAGHENQHVSRDI